MSARVAKLAIALLVCHGATFAPAQAQTTEPDRAACDKFLWPVDKERAWFAEKSLPRRASGARLKKRDRAVELSLRPSNEVSFFLPPKVAPKPHSFSGAVTFFGVPEPGLYQVTLSEPASVDVFENGVRLQPVGHTRQSDCPELFESVRYDLAPGDLVLVQITNARTKSIKVAFEQAESRVAW